MRASGIEPAASRSAVLDLGIREVSCGASDPVEVTLDGVEDVIDRLTLVVSRLGRDFGSISISRGFVI